MELHDQHRHWCDRSHDSSGVGCHHEGRVRLQPNWLGQWWRASVLDVQLRDGRELQQSVQHTREDARPHQACGL